MYMCIYHLFMPSSTSDLLRSCTDIICLNAYINVYIHVQYAYMHSINVYIQIYMHKYIYIHIYIYTHTHHLFMPSSTSDLSRSCTDI